MTMPSENDPKTLWERLNEDQASTPWVDSESSPVVVGASVKLKDGSSWRVQKVSYVRSLIRMRIAGQPETTITSSSEVTLVSDADKFALKKMPVEALEAELMNVPTLWERLGESEE